MVVADHSAVEPLIDVSEVQSFAREHTQENQGKWIKTERLGGFCLLIKKDVIKRIGPDLDEHTDLGLFDTDILSSKARQVGYSMAICRDLFIHHFGTRTFAHTAPVIAEATQTANR